MTSIGLTIISFMSGLLYERWKESKNTLDIDHSLSLLLAKPSDFVITGGEWSNIAYFQDYVNPSINKYRTNYESGRSEFRANFPETNAILDFVHVIEKYEYGETPKTTYLDETYLSGKQSKTLRYIYLI